MYKLQLKSLRKAAGIKTQKEMADRLGIPERRYASWEREEVGINLEQACEIADVLNCTLDELIGREITPEMRKNSREAQALLDAREVLEQAIRASGYENLGDDPYTDDDGFDDDITDEEADALSDGYSSSQGRSMLDAIDEISSGEY